MVVDFGIAGEGLFDAAFLPAMDFLEIAARFIGGFVLSDCWDFAADSSCGLPFAEFTFVFFRAILDLDLEECALACNFFDLGSGVADFAVFFTRGTCFLDPVAGFGGCGVILALKTPGLFDVDPVVSIFFCGVSGGNILAIMSFRWLKTIAAAMITTSRIIKTPIHRRSNNRFIGLFLTSFSASIVCGREGKGWDCGDSSSIFFKALSMELNIIVLLG